MMRTYHVTTSEFIARRGEFSVGDAVFLSGQIYTARDAAHKRIVDMLSHKQELPFDLTTAVIYYAGPTPARQGRVIGSCGPTTSSRMDAFTPTLLANGLTAMIGKGPRSVEVLESMKRYGAIYATAVGGAGAVMGKCIADAQIVAFEELGCEAIRRLTVKDLPIYIAVDTMGKTLFTQGGLS